MDSVTERGSIIILYYLAPLVYIIDYIIVYIIVYIIDPLLVVGPYPLVVAPPCSKALLSSPLANGPRGYLVPRGNKGYQGILLPLACIQGTNPWYMYQWYM